MKFVLAAVVAFLASPVLAQDGVREYLSAKDEATKETALKLLENVPVPKDAAQRVRVLRAGLAVEKKPGGARVEEELSTGTSYVVTPKKYDPKGAAPVVFSLHGRHGSGHDGLQPFALPDAEWEELEKKVRPEAEAEAKKKGIPPSAVRITRPKPLMPWDDGLVLAPNLLAAGEEYTLAHAEKVCFAALSRLSRSYAGELDRVVLVGISSGADLAHHLACARPDRFAGLVGMAGGARLDEPLENLRPLQIYIVHGAKDDSVPVTEGRTLDAKLKELGVVHVYRELAQLGHRWPLGGDPEYGKLMSWMRERRRTAWPKTIEHSFRASVEPRRVFWVEVPAGGDDVFKASVKDNEIAVSGPCVLHLGEPLVDLEKEIVVTKLGVEVFRGKLSRSWKELLRDLESDGFDVGRAAPARLEVK